MLNRTHLLGVYGGSFDPIHLGHLVPVEEARAATGLDEILYVPAFAPPHKPQGPSASAFHRFGMCAAALEAYPHLLLSDFEVSRGGTTYTIETLRHVRANHPESEVFLVLGSDSRISAGDPNEWSYGAQRTDTIMLLTAPASGTRWDMVSCASPVPGGMSTTR